VAYVLDVENPEQYGEDALRLLQASTVITTFRANRGLYVRDDYQFIYWRPCDNPDVSIHPDISESKTSEDEAMLFMMMADILDPNDTIQKSRYLIFSFLKFET
jgi:hypothetical protein